MVCRADGNESSQHMFAMLLDASKSQLIDIVEMMMTVGVDEMKTGITGLKPRSGPGQTPEAATDVIVPVRNEREENNRRKAHKSESSRSNRDVSTQSNVDSSRQTTKYNEGDIVTQYKIIRNNSNQAPKTTSTETRTENVVSNENTMKDGEKRKKKKKKKSKSPEKQSEPLSFNRDVVPVAIPLPPKNDCRTVATLSQPSTSSQSSVQHPSTNQDQFTSSHVQSEGEIQLSFLNWEPGAKRRAAMDQAMSKLLALRAEDEMVEKALKKERKRSKRETETEKPILVRRVPDAVPATENTVQTENVLRPAPEQQRPVERPRAPTPKPTVSDASENEASSSDSESDSEESDDDSSDSSSEEEEEENGDDHGTGGGATSNSTQNPPPPPPPTGGTRGTQKVEREEHAFE
ncbi:immunoglobulin A1 protease autotransporter-like [Planococcus citri]|uniref:immunoglobulin A1 protease autotransporter-like n=1 Tax=Planococcus citri TaxID=170843 RepID=UPI0031F789F4